VDRRAPAEDGRAEGTARRREFLEKPSLRRVEDRGCFGPGSGTRLYLRARPGVQGGRLRWLDQRPDRGRQRTEGAERGIAVADRGVRRGIEVSEVRMKDSPSRLVSPAEDPLRIHRQFINALDTGLG
jgi:hypothetical protein